MGGRGVDDCVDMIYLRCLMICLYCLTATGLCGFNGRLRGFSTADIKLGEVKFSFFGKHSDKC